MKITADTNVLVRFLVEDGEEQTRKVQSIFESAEKIFVPTNVLSELVWVLSHTFKLNNIFIITKINSLLSNPKIIVNDLEVDFGLKVLEQNGDFADGINAFAGKEFFQNEKSQFVSFDKKAIKILTNLGIDVLPL